MTPRKPPDKTPRPQPVTAAGERARAAAETSTVEEAEVAAAAAVVSEEVHGDITKKLADLLDTLRDERKLKELSAHLREVVHAEICQHRLECPVVDMLNEHEGRIKTMENFRAELQGITKGAIKTLIAACTAITLVTAVVGLLIAWGSKFAR